MHRVLHDLALAYKPGEHLLDPHKSAPIGLWAFGGGTSLASAFRITERYSEDIDVLVVMPGIRSAGPLKRIRREFASLISETAPRTEEDECRRRGGGDISVVEVDIDGESSFLKFDITRMQHIPGTLERRTVVPLMGRVATDAERSRYPEVGGFDVIGVSPAVTAINKFLALNRYAEAGHYRGLARRGRDLYDLARIAGHERYAEQVRTQAAELAEALASGVRRSTREGRPEGGFAQSSAFIAGTAANDALRNGYANMQDMIFGETIGFDDAVRLARSLDNPS